ncbi:MULTISPECIES: hypothetical protein [unclassified Nocardioides]|uniref:hypothetical protein n=1 Tax=unclassified Nocardioides TaxID=2615069 RepID=UPI0006FE1DAA|nr:MULTISPECIES: hypothetical protein [unclassified Nocardioides]KRA37345.1 hypothetical protein ASD81_01000 [Nocardioides sp. Root614]KRA91306.1 hypothetical protein ASD84_01265 [Nocardioides sp. Root682]
MTPDLHACLSKQIDAERAGDLTAALEWHRAVPMFSRGRHRTMLDRLTAAGEELPEWVWARWIAYLTMRCQDGAAGAVMRSVLTDVVKTAHGDLLDACYDDGGDPIKVAGTVMGESWLYQQIVVHDAGGLVEFIDEHVTGRLAEHADLARSWAGARMSGYEMGRSLPGARLQVRDAGQDDWTEVLDLGARSCSADGWVLGRLVPSGLAETPMFDVPPLGVPAEVAHAVAAADNWRDPLADALEAGTPSRCFLREDYELCTDVQELDLIRFGTATADLGRVMGQLRSGRDEGSRAAYRVLHRARDGEIDPTEQAYVAAAALFPRALADARRQLVRPGEYDVWAAWAQQAASPAHDRLLVLTEAARAAA